jgi:hypothetical protein
MRPLKVTVLCDSQIQRDLDVAALHQNGYEATGMASAAELDICGPDVVLINLSGMDGDPFALVQTFSKHHLKWACCWSSPHTTKTTRRGHTNRVLTTTWSGLMSRASWWPL